jgi:HD-like signal output (HDOD) protein
MELVGARPASGRDRILRSLDQLPPFSPILNRLIATLAQEHVSFAELAEMIEKDTVLAGNLLRLVNSPLYGLRGTINSVRHAVSLVGLNKLRNVVLALSLARMWHQTPSARSWSTSEFNLHSAATATLSDLLVEYLPVAYPEGAFTAGLFHDLGKLLIATALPKEYETLHSLSEQGKEDLEESEREVIGFSHAQLSASALKHWNLPLPIQKAVKFHHAPEPVDGGQQPLSRVVHVADLCVNRLGITILPLRPPNNEAPEESLEILGLDEQIPRLMQEFKTELELIRGFF